MRGQTNFGWRVVPALLVRDMAETLGFYQQLGFELTEWHPYKSEPTWVEVRRDGVVFQFHLPPPVGTLLEPALSGSFYVYPADVRLLAEEWRGQVPFAWGPEVMSYGMREFAVQDPNGYLIAFTEPVEA